MEKECFCYQLGITLLLKLQGHTILFHLNSEYVFKPNQNYSSPDSCLIMCYLAICIS